MLLDIIVWMVLTVAKTYYYVWRNYIWWRVWRAMSQDERSHYFAITNNTYEAPWLILIKTYFLSKTISQYLY